MRIGIASAQIGRLADPAAVRATARAADQVGYASLWVLDRLPAPLQPRSGYRGTAGVALPPGEDRALDPFVVLAAAAAVTERVRIGTSVLVAPWYPPAVLARLLTSLDVLSEGRLTVGLGSGWSLDEHEAAGVPFARRGAHLDEVLDVLDVCWGDGPLAYQGPRTHLAPSSRLLRPLQRPRPPVLLAGATPAALERVARRADGWMPVGLPPEVIGSTWQRVRDRAAVLGRRVEDMRLVVRADITLTDRPLGDGRAGFQGTLEQVIDDVEATREAGADEVILHVVGDVGLDEALDACARIAEAVDLPTPARTG